MPVPRRSSPTPRPFSRPGPDRRGPTDRPPIRPAWATREGGPRPPRGDARPAGRPEGRPEGRPYAGPAESARPRTRLVWTSGGGRGRPPGPYDRPARPGYGRDTDAGGPPPRPWTGPRRSESGEGGPRPPRTGTSGDSGTYRPRPAYGKPPYGKPPFGKPSYGKPAYAKPAYRRPEAPDPPEGEERRPRPAGPRPFYEARFEKRRPSAARPPFSGPPKGLVRKPAVPAPVPQDEPPATPVPHSDDAAVEVLEAMTSETTSPLESMPVPAPRPARAPRPPRAPRPAVPIGAPDFLRPAIGPEVDPDDTMPTAYLRAGEADRILGGHPWIYEGCLLRLTRDLADGDVIQVKDHRRRFLGVGFYNSRSRIRIRLLHTERRELDEAFFTERIAAAIAHRRRFLPDATSYRVVSAEGDRLSGLIVDKYEDVLVVQTTSLGMDTRKAMIVGVLQKLLQPRAILERNDMGSRKFEGLPEAGGLLAGELSEAEQAALPVQLNGLRFEANVLAGHKTGLYLDQQLNHALVARYARGARVLDAFSFIGGFALPAARAGATAVLGVDQSEEATATARRLATANGLDPVCTFESGNAFDWLRSRLAPATAGNAEAADPGPDKLFDLVILDPPSFTRNRASIPDALRGYKEIHLRALRLLRPGGVLATFCCSHHVDAAMFQAAINEAALDARRQLRRLETYTQAPDHPVLPAVPETEYLKGFAFELLGA